ncbi:MAG TPA: response regulator [Thermoanaerobaculia bacterium]|jgi:DNA-binding response OmpR family regulator|nr:response regulator [Thermoanaerobaculia bacterium]
MTGPRRILLVEDREEVAVAVAALLAEHGCEVEIALNGTEGVSAVDAWLPDLVILDFSLPDFDGREVQRRMRGAHPDLPIIFVSADHPDLRDLLEARPDCTAFLHKPYDGASLTALIDRLTPRG